MKRDDTWWEIAAVVIVVLLLLLLWRRNRNGGASTGFTLPDFNFTAPSFDAEPLPDGLSMVVNAPSFDLPAANGFVLPKIPYSSQVSPCGCPVLPGETPFASASSQAAYFASLPPMGDYSNYE